MTNENTNRRKITNNERAFIIRKYYNNTNIKQISEELEMNRNTVTSIIRLFEKTGRIEMKSTRSPRRKLLNDEAILFIRNEVDREVSLTLKALKTKVYEQLNISCSTTTIENALKKLHYTFKRVELVPERRNIENNINIREIYCDHYLRLDDSKVVFLDEFGVSCSTRQKFGRSLVGTTPRKQIRAIRSKSFSVCAAVCKKKILAYEVRESAYNRGNFISYLLHLLNILHEERMVGVTIIMDNCSIHKGDEIRDIIQNQGHELLFLPAYSPQLNPIEETFSKWKSLIKDTNSNTREELINAIMNSMSRIREDDCISYFNHVRDFAVRGVRGRILIK
jgi:transposase